MDHLVYENGDVPMLWGGGAVFPPRIPLHAIKITRSLPLLITDRL